MKRRSLLGTLALSALAPVPARACLWDSDTLAAEGKGREDVLQIITGRFDRLPARYYERRLEIAGKALADSPAKFELYDNAGVACDRLGQHDEAIAWMARKRAVLDKFKHPQPVPHYRYLANLGTFHAHRWIKAGAPADNLADLDTATQLITRAIALNPEAHFGREKYQKMALEWLGRVKRRKPGAPPEIPFLGLRGQSDVRDEGRLREAGIPDAVAGVSGLIQLGTAWESVDVFYNLQLALQLEGRNSPAYLAWLRRTELMKQGKKSLDPDAKLDAETLLEAVEPVIAYYRAARKEADGWVAARNEYAGAMMDAGRHPDTDPLFWSGFRSRTTPPRLPGK